MKKRMFFISFMIVLAVFTMAACTSTEETVDSSTNEETTGSEESAETSNSEEAKVETEDNEVVNLYTSRHYDTDAELYKQFTENTGIEVNVVQGNGNELMERLDREGESTEADVFITADAGNLHRLKERDLLQSIQSDRLEEHIPEKLRDIDHQWFGLTKRARVIVYAKDRVDPSELSTYEDLTDPKWEGRVLIRSSENIYNQSLLGSFIELNGEDQAIEWAQGIVNNMARDPKGGDTDQLKAVVAGEGDVAIMNTYYVGRLLNSTNTEEVNVAEQVGVFFPNQETTGTHVNISGAGVTKHAKNVDQAIKFIEFLSSPEAQAVFAEGNNEYPVNPDVEPTELLQSWGEFKEQDIDLSILGLNNAQAIRIFNQVGWK